MIYVKKYLYFVGCALIGLALAKAGIYTNSIHFYTILGSAFVMVIGWHLRQGIDKQLTSVNK